MNNLFETLPLNFFSILNGQNKELMSDCIFILYNFMKDDTSFATLKDNVIFELIKYFNTHIVDMNDIESQSSKEKAYYVYRRLKECGWISEDQNENYRMYVSFEDYAIAIIETLNSLDKEKDIEYSSMVYSIYSGLLNFDVNNGHMILDAQYNMTKNLMSKLKNLNTSIKKHIKKLLKDNIKNNLNEILESLLSDYQMKIIDRAFYNLMTRDNPLKYRNSIISQIQKVRDDDVAIDIIVRNIMDTKDLGYTESLDFFNEQTLYIIEAFESIEDLTAEITRKNEKFVAAATNRILFLINVKEDIGGKINELIKEGQNYPQVFETITQISVNKFLDEKSLYTPRQLKKPMETELILEPVLDKSVKEKAINKLKMNEKYSRSSIENNILKKLEINSEILGSKFYEETNDISIFALTWLYGYSQKAKYQIVPQDNIVKKDQYRFREFVIRGVE